MQFLVSVQSTPDPASPTGSRSVPGHDPATPVLKRLNSPVSIFDALDESPPRVPPKTIREFRRKWSFGGGHSGGVRTAQAPPPISASAREPRGARRRQGTCAVRIDCHWHSLTTQEYQRYTRSNKGHEHKQTNYKQQQTRLRHKQLRSK